ncbi:MAG: VTT domain-containing protein [Candidatus Paceibacterota bacterium]|jgi:membrane-associated protein
MDSLQNIIIAFGYIGVFTAIFAESGFLLGFFLPGDSLLFTVGLLASTGVFNIWVLIVGCILAAILGDSFGYYIGKRIGPSLFTRDDSYIFKKKYLLQTQEFYEKYGKKTIVLARFVPIVRTFAPIIAGVGNMKYSTFITYNVIGGITWTTGFLLMGFLLGKTVPGIEQYMSLIIAGIIILSFMPIAWEFFKKSRQKKV